MIADSLRKSILQAAIEGKLTEREPGDGDARDLLAEIQKEKARLVREGKIRRPPPPRRAAPHRGKAGGAVATG